MIKNEEKLCKDSASFEDSRKRIDQGKFHKLNEAMHLWYTKCCPANLYPTGALIQEGSIADERENDRNYFIDSQILCF